MAVIEQLLRPMSTGELLDRTVDLYRKNFVLFVGITAIMQAVYLAYEILTVKSSIPHIGRFGTFYLHLFLSWTVGMLVLSVSHAATVKAVAAVYLDQPTSIWQSYRGLRGRLMSVFGVLGFTFLVAGLVGVLLVFAAFLVVVLVIVGAGGVSGVGIARSGTANFAIGIIVILATFASFVAVYVRYALAIQACVVENLKAWASMKRSVFLSKGGRWRIAAVYMVFVLLGWVIAFALAWLVGLARVPLHNRLLSQILVEVGNFIAGTLTGPLVTIGVSLIYYDERVRKEAFDLQLMLASLDAPQTPAEVSPVSMIP
jgi:hypothetical protein